MSNLPLKSSFLIYVLDADSDLEWDSHKPIE